MDTELDHHHYMALAYDQAVKSHQMGGCSIGAVLVNNNGDILGVGHNRLVQEGNPILHGEMAALRAAGRMKNRKDTTLYTTLSPCMMCTGTIIQFKIHKVVIGDSVNANDNEQLLMSKGVCVIRYPHQPCIELVRQFRNEQPELWYEDWGG